MRGPLPLPPLYHESGPMLAGAYLFPPLHDVSHLPAGDSKSRILLCKESISRMIFEGIYMIDLYFHKLIIIIIIIISAHKSDFSYPWSQTQASLSIPSLHQKNTNKRREREEKNNRRENLPRSDRRGREKIKQLTGHIFTLNLSHFAYRNDSMLLIPKPWGQKLFLK